MDYFPLKFYQYCNIYKNSLNTVPQILWKIHVLLPMTNSYPLLLFLILDEFLRPFFEQNNTKQNKI